MYCAFSLKQPPSSFPPLPYIPYPAAPEPKKTTTHPKKGPPKSSFHLSPALLCLNGNGKREPGGGSEKGCSFFVIYLGRPVSCGLLACVLPCQPGKKGTWPGYSWHSVPAIQVQYSLTHYPIFKIPGQSPCAGAAGRGVCHDMYGVCQH